MGPATLMKPRPITLVLILAVSAVIAASVRGDQYAWNSLAVCTNALARLTSGSFVISFCSECDDQHAELWQVDKAVIALTPSKDRYEVHLSVQKVLRTATRFDRGKWNPDTPWQTMPQGTQPCALEAVDLAYLYLRVEDGSFRVAAEVLELKPLEVAVPRIQLPAPVNRLLRPPGSEPE